MYAYVFIEREPAQSLSRGGLTPVHGIRSSARNKNKENKVIEIVLELYNQ
jgi:hypothetical protein